MYLEETNTTHVNLDSDLQVFLKEIYYLSSLGITLPERIYRKVEHLNILTIRSYATRLLTATSQFDIINKELKDVEKALIQEQITKAQNVSAYFEKKNLWIGPGI